MIQLAEQVDFFKDLFPLAEFEIFFANNFDCSVYFGKLVNTTSNTAQGAFSNSFMQFVVVFNVIGVFEVEFLRVQFNFITSGRLEFALLLDQLLKVLSRELYDVFRACTHYFFDVVFEDAWERVGYFDLLGCENALVVNV